MLVVLGIIETIENDKQKLFIERLYKKYGAWVLKNAYDIVNDYTAAQDILNDTFIKLIRHVDVLLELEDYKIGSYVRQTIQTCAYTYLAKESHELQKAEKWGKTLEDQLIADMGIENLVDNLELYDALNKMDERDRSLLICKYGFRLSYKDIGEMHHMPSHSIATYVKRAKSRLIEILKREMR